MKRCDKLGIDISLTIDAEGKHFILMAHDSYLWLGRKDLEAIFHDIGDMLDAKIQSPGALNDVP